MRLVSFLIKRMLVAGKRHREAHSGVAEAPTRSYHHQSSAVSLLYGFSLSTATPTILCTEYHIPLAKITISRELDSPPGGRFIICLCMK